MSEMAKVAALAVAAFFVVALISALLQLASLLQ